MKIQKPKKGSKVLCLAEIINNPNDPTIFPPNIGWVYLVESVHRMNDSFDFDPKGKKIGITLVGFGFSKNEPDMKFIYDSDSFRVVGRAKIISHQ